MISYLVTQITRHQVALALPTSPEDEAQSRGILAGLLSASRALLAPPEYARLIARCEIDPCTLDTLLAPADSDPSCPSDTSHKSGQIIDL